MAHNTGKSPAFQFYAADYLADEAVQLLTLEEEGAYIRLLAYCWREGSIPADPEKLSRLCKGGSTTLVRVVQALFQPHPEDGSRMIHARLEKERAKQREWQDKSAEGGKKSAEARNKAKNATVVQPPFNHPSNGGSTTLDQMVQPKGNSSFAFASSSSKEQIQGFDHSMVATAVMHELSLAGQNLLRNLSDIAKIEIAKGQDGEALVKKMTAAWTDYEASKSKLDWQAGPEKFFGNGLWRDKDGWPWKEGQRPVKRKYLEAVA